MGHTSHHYKMTRTYYKHSDSPDFSRIIVTVHNKSGILYSTMKVIYSLLCFINIDVEGEAMSLAFVKYRFDRAEHSIDIKSHGNSIKEGAPFRRTNPSTLNLLKKGVVNQTPLTKYSQMLRT